MFNFFTVLICIVHDFLYFSSFFFAPWALVWITCTDFFSATSNLLSNLFELLILVLYIYIY